MLMFTPTTYPFIIYNSLKDEQCSPLQNACMYNEIRKLVMFCKDVGMVGVYKRANNVRPYKILVCIMKQEN